VQGELKMSKEVTMGDIFQAITEIADELKETKSELKQDISNVDKKIDRTKSELKEDISKVDKKTDLINRKFSIFSDNHLTQQAEIRELQKVNNLL